MTQKILEEQDILCYTNLIADILLFLRERMPGKEGKYMGNEKKRILAFLGLTAGLSLLVILCYSEGFLALRPTDASIIRAGLSLFVAPMSVFVFCYAGYHLLKSPKKVVFTKETLMDIGKAREILQQYRGGKQFGRLAEEALSQTARLENSSLRARMQIESRFGKTSMTSDRYLASIELAKEVSLDNIITIANRLQLFDEKEYARLQHYKEDDIPDDIQERQIELYRKNTEAIKEAIAANERLMLSLDSMSAGLVTQTDGQADETIENIEKLTQQLKLYRNNI